MPQFFIDKQLSKHTLVEIRGSDARHISQVLRLKKGEWIVLSNGRGENFKAEIIDSNINKVTANILEKIESGKRIIPPTLAFSIIKHDKSEIIIQKAVELGVNKIIPFVSERTVPRLSSSLTQSRMKRWNRIALEAAKQSGLPHKPEVLAPLPLQTIFKMSKNFSNTILFWEGEKKKDLLSIRSLLKKEKSSLIIIGPEGGFSDKEITDAHNWGIATVSLGKQILRVETAVISALSICLYELGGFNIG